MRARANKTRQKRRLTRRKRRWLGVAVAGVVAAAGVVGGGLWLNRYTGDVACFDYDADGDVDGVDFAVFSGCFNRAGRAPRCGPDLAWRSDQDSDGDVDGSDFIAFQACYGKSGRPYRHCRFPRILYARTVDEQGLPSQTGFASFNGKKTLKRPGGFKKTTSGTITVVLPSRAAAAARGRVALAPE